MFRERFKIWYAFLNFSSGATRNIFLTDFDNDLEEKCDHSLQKKCSATTAKVESKPLHHRS